MDDVWVSRYFLEAAGSLNARSQRVVYEGVLVRIGSGFGCLHPWPELGDPTVIECLQDLARGRETALVKKTLACIEADGKAREEGRSLFDELKVPSSHATLPVLTEAAVEEAVSKGFGFVKTKAGRGGVSELELIRSLVRTWPELRWRIDYNEAGLFEEIVAGFRNWDAAELGVIDFLEDPVRYDPVKWRDLSKVTGLSLGNDRHQEEDDGSSAVLVQKPAVDILRKGRQRMVVTSYMDHPVGQCYAAWEAARIGCREVCGLQTHGLFKRDEFTELLGAVGPDFVVPDGPGLGFGDLLEGLEWKRLARDSEG